MIRILLQYDDPYFVNALSRYASAKCPDIDILCFTTKEKAESYLDRKSPRIDIVISEEAITHNGNPVASMRLYPGDRTEFTPDGNGSHINIYQAGSAIFTDIKSAYALADGTQPIAHSLHIISTFSVEGGCGSTTVCYALAAAVARQGGQVLFLNLEPAAYTDQLYEDGNDKSIDELLYVLFDGRNAASELLNTAWRNQDNVLVLPPFHSEKDRRALKKQHIQSLISSIEKSTDYQYLFVNLPTDLQDLSVWVLEESTAVINVYSDTKRGRFRMQAMEHALDELDLKIPGRLVNVLNRCGSETEEAGIDGKIPYSESLSKGVRVGAVLDRNPSYLRACENLLQRID